MPLANMAFMAYGRPGNTPNRQGAAMQNVRWQAIASANLEIAMDDTGEGPIFDRFFAGYDRAFILPNEKEDKDGFRTCLALNHGDAHTGLAREYGRFREICLIARDPSDGSEIGGANFIALEGTSTGHSVLTANLNYIYVANAARGRGYFGRLVSAVCEAVKLVLPIDAEPLVFIELNDPLRMPAEDYARDTAFTGLDQIDRIRIWAKQGARVVDHPYVQPPLAPDGEPDDNLIYGLLSDVPAIDACILRDHLRQFFGISVLKGAPLRTSASASGQIETLDAHCTSGARIALLDPQRFLGRVRCRDDIGTVFPVWPESARAAIRQSA